MRDELMSGDESDEPVAYLGAPSDGESDDGRSVSRSASPEPARAAKKSRKAELEDDEELALRLLRGE